MKQFRKNLKTEIGGLPLDYQDITITPSGNINVNAPSLRTDFNGNASFNLTGKAPGEGIVYLSVAFEYDLITIYASGNEGAEEQPFDHKEVIKECIINVTVYDTAEIVTNTPADIICTSATVGGYVIDDNNEPVTERGVIINGSKISSGSGEGTFSVTLRGLTPNTNYSVQAYATNLAGIAYGKKVVFSTLSNDCVNISSTVLKDTTCVCKCTVFTVRTNVISDENEMITERGVYFGTSDNPEITGTKYQSGSGTGSFIKMFTDLPDNTTYYVKGYAILSSDTTILGNQAIFSSGGTVTDIDGNVYNTIPIGSQIWMAENLRASSYNDGTLIPHVIDGEAWANLTTGAYCWYSNLPSMPVTGALYNGYAVQTGKLCPVGWHVPHYTEVHAMERYLVAKGFNYDGTFTEYENKIAKALASANLWATSVVTGSIGRNDYPDKINATCFNSLPGGYRHAKWGGFADAFFMYLGEHGYWWTSDSELYYSLRYNYTCLFPSIGCGSDAFGFSVRCVKDQ